MTQNFIESNIRTYNSLMQSIDSSKESKSSKQTVRKALLQNMSSFYQELNNELYKEADSLENPSFRSKEDLLDKLDVMLSKLEAEI